MAKYSDIKGFTVQTLASDTAASQFVGGAWSSASSMNNARLDMGSSQAATQSSGILAGGSPTPGYDKSEAWNGSSWTEVAELNQPRGESPGGAGIYTSAIVFGGFTTTNVANSESWNGSAWTATPALNNGRRALSGGFGTANTAAIAVGGYASSTVRNNVESWNGSAWTEVNEMNTGRNSGAGVGTTTAGILYGGSAAPGVFSNVETWDGTNFTETTEINTARDGLAGAGTQTSALASGGYATDRVAITEHWNGSSWTELADLSLARDCNNNGFGTADAAIVGGGSSAAAPSGTGATELFDAPAIFSKQIEGQLFFNSTANAFKETINDFAGATWGSGASLNTARERMGGASQGTPSAGLVCGGPGSPYGQTEEYDGTAWSEQNDLNEGRYISGGGCGTQTALVYAGGYDPAGSPNYDTNSSETYNGTSWTAGNNLNEGRIDCYSVGTATAGMLIGGAQAAGGPGTVDSVELYDGTSWSETTNLPTVTQEMGALGLQTASLIFGGSVDSDPTTKNTTIEWNGTSWTASNNYPFSVKYTTAFGSQTSGIAAGGEKIPGGGTAVCNRYDGTSWTEIAELSTARTSLVGNGAASSNGLSGFVAGGYAPGGTTDVTEELTVPLANKTITAS